MAARLVTSSPEERSESGGSSSLESEENNCRDFGYEARQGGEVDAPRTFQV